MQTTIIVATRPWRWASQEMIRRIFYVDRFALCSCVRSPRGGLPCRGRVARIVHRAPTTAPQLPEVTVANPSVRQVPDYAEYTGRTDALESVDIRSRVSGYLKKIDFKPGDEVPTGKVLFQIDPDPFQADVDKAKAQVTTLTTRLARLKKDVERYTALLPQKAISQQDYDKAVADEQETASSIDGAKAAMEHANLMLKFTRVTAPCDGKIGRDLISVGNLVAADTTVLAHIVSVGQIYVYFDVDENAFQRFQKYEAQLSGSSKLKHEADVQMRRATDEKFSHSGKIDFIDVELNRNTGTIKVRAVFDNKDDQIKAGEFADIRLPLGNPADSLTVPEEAVGSDLGRKYVFVVDKQDKVHYTPITTGTARDGYIVVRSGLKPDDQVIVDGIQRARDGVTVKAQRAADEKPAADKSALVLETTRPAESDVAKAWRARVRHLSRDREVAVPLIYSFLSL